LVIANKDKAILDWVHLLTTTGLSDSATSINLSFWFYKKTACFLLVDKQFTQFYDLLCYAEYSLFLLRLQFYTDPNT